MQNKKVSKSKIFLPCHSSVKWSSPGDFLKAQFVIFRFQKYFKKRVHGNEKMNLPCAFKKCPGSLHFTLLIPVYHISLLKIRVSVTDLITITLISNKKIDV